MRSASFALLIMLACLAPSGARAETPADICGACTPARTPYAAEKLREGEDFRGVMLRMHNAERARWQVPALAWNDRLAASATAWATRLARQGMMQHGSDLGGRHPIGENLWMGTRGAYVYEDMVGSFLDERRYYVARAIPDISATGNWADAAHYSQVIWRSTTAVGCGMASGDNFDVLVCRYDPAGNIWGQRADEPEDGFGGQRMRIASDGHILRSR